MSWITPLGFLGLLGIVALIIIYILKPQYQQKFISSTYVWELSLKYRKKKIPINKFRNILLFLCQILAITSCAMILAQPVIKEASAPIVIDRVAIIDASASMRTAYDEESRFERAVFKTESLARETFEEEGFVTIIFAGAEATYIAQRATAEESFDIYTTLSDLVQNDSCTYGLSDIECAIDLAQKIVDQNADTEVFLYTATEYLDDGGEVNVVDVSQNGEWNAAILNCEAYLEENYFTFKVTVAAYDRDTDLMVYCDVKGANGAGTVKLEMPVRCNSDQAKTISFVTANSTSPVYEFESVRVYLSESDSFSHDNDFFIYGGKKPTLNMLYFNPHANIFFGGIMLSARSNLKDWDINYKEINSILGLEEIPTSGYDFYVYEGMMPDVLPTDGVVMLVNMDKTPEGLPAVQGPEVNGTFTLTAGGTHPITNRMDPSKIEIFKYNRMLNYEGFEPLLYCSAGDPVLFVKDTPDQKIIMMNFSVNFSLASMYVEFPMLMYNILEYFLPSTLSTHSFDINQTISLDARSEELKIEAADGSYKDTFKEFPKEIVLTKPGSYTLSQLPISGQPQVEQFFVKIPASESNISQTQEDLYDLIVVKKDESNNLDLLLYFAAALVALIFMERLLQARDM